MLTPDDESRSKEEDKNAVKDRARQNVILELGYFMGKLGRGKVCCLYKKGVELPSDLFGILYIQYDSKVEYSYLAIAKELRKAGYTIGWR